MPRKPEKEAADFSILKIFVLSCIGESTCANWNIILTLHPQRNPPMHDFWTCITEKYKFPKPKFFPKNAKKFSKTIKNSLFSVFSLQWSGSRLLKRIWGGGWPQCSRTAILPLGLSQAQSQPPPHPYQPLSCRGSSKSCISCSA
jgi:hypothetical protein